MVVTIVGRGVQGVDSFVELWRTVLNRIDKSKRKDVIESPLSKGEIRDLLDAIPTIFPNATSPETKKSTQYGVIEIAARDIFNRLLASTNTTDARFVRLWNLLDTIAILSDDEQCDPALLFWLVEELLDSQPIAGCRKVFDYLESRRERITAKHFAQKNLIILRTCNELLRRLSRAEDTAFCGRVFIFMFQSFPLGDKSSVNLRGEYHTENVTTWDEPTVKEPEPERESEKMEVDAEEKSKDTPPKVEELSTSVKSVSSSKTAQSPMCPDALYPIFWALQKGFNQPKRLFDCVNFSAFKTGLEQTMTMFKSLQAQTSKRITSNKATEEGKRGMKRKRDEDEDNLANAFNPKYLTSRDLFELEISDVSFQRYVLIQVLIVMDFLLSLSKKAKEKLASATLASANKSVIYADIAISDEDVTWATEMKKSAADYLRQDPFFYRMVETVLSRDKNWVRWKIENCPSISQQPIPPEDYVAAKTTTKKLTQNKRLRPTPLGSLDLMFLADSNIQSGLERLKDPSRYEVPSVKSFESKIDLDNMDIEMAMDHEKKNTAIESKFSKSWRALRLASSSKLVVFDKIERSDNITQIFRDDVKLDESMANGEEVALEGEDVAISSDRRPIAIAGPSGASKRKLIEKLVSKYGRSFAKKVSHTTRAPREGEVNGQHYHFVAKEAFNVLRDGDDLLEYNSFDGDDFGTSRKVVEGIIAAGKIPIMEMEMHGIQQLKENAFIARNVFVPTFEEESDEKGSTNPDLRKKEMEYSKLDGSFDTVLDASDLEGCFAQLEKYLWGDEVPGTVIAQPRHRSSDVVVPEPAMLDTVAWKIKPEPAVI